MSFEFTPIKSASFEAPDPNNFHVLMIKELAGLNTRESDSAMDPDEFNSLQNLVLVGSHLRKRKGLANFGTAQTGTKVAGVGYHENDSGITPLMMVGQTLYKYVASAWAASDKTNYTADLDTQILQFNSKSGSSSDSGTSSSGSTINQVEDTSKTWTPGQWFGYCVVIAGEVKYISDNTATVLILGEKMNSNVDSDYQSKSYAIYVLSPHAFIMNGTDAVQKYDLTTTTPIDGSQVTNGKALPIAKVGCTHQGRMWLAEGKGNNNDRVFLTDVGVGENVTTDTNLNVNLQFFNDGDDITAIGSMPLQQGSACVVAKTSSVHVIEGENVLNYTSRPIIAREGCMARKSFAIGRGTAFMLAKDGKVLSVADIGAEPLSDALPINLEIQPDIQAISTTNQAAACGVVFDNKYFLRVGDSMWYYDIEQSLHQNRHVWVDMSYDLGYVHFNSMAVVDNTLYAGDSTSGQAYQMFSGNSDLGDAIEIVIDSGEISYPGNPHMWVDRVEIMAEESDSTVFSLQFLTDGGAFGPFQSQTLTRADRRYVFDVKSRCKSFRFKMVERSTNAATSIVLPIKVFYRRGESGEDGTKG